MRFAFFSDIHGNIEALDACLSDLEAQGGADRVIGVGDYCMDGPKPRAVLERLREIGATCVRGNTDRYIASMPLSEFDPDDREMILWQRKTLGDEWVRWLADLPFSIRIGLGKSALLVVHANPKSDEEHLWPDADEACMERIFRDVIEQTVVFGHLHIPYVRVWRDKLLINVASAGLPKDGDPRAGYALLTERPGGWEVKHRRVKFDVDRVVRQIERSGLPSAKKRISTLRRHRYKELVDTIP